jgi:hypothetical protein
VSAIVHLAGELADGVQACSRCGEVLIDYRGTVTADPCFIPFGYPPGPVTTLPFGSVTGAADGAAPCVAQGPPN